jgi:hypothetical protein
MEREDVGGWFEFADGDEADLVRQSVYLSHSKSEAFNHILVDFPWRS